jgi:hypothetical protein
MSYLQAALKVEVCAPIERVMGKPESVSQISAEQNPIDTGEHIIPFPEEWISRFDETTLERLAIMTVDGGLTDSEALEAIEQKPHIRLVEKKALPQEPKAIWSNPFPKGTPEARQESFRIIEEAKTTTRHDREI